MIKKTDLKTRSTLSIDAVAKAAANAGANTLRLPRSRIGAIAGLAGFVLHLFRQKTSQTATRPPAQPRRTPPGDSRTRPQARRAVQGPAGASARKGGTRHG